MKKTIVRVLVVIFVIVAIFITANILSYNDYEVAEFGNKSLVLADKHLEKYGYKKGDLLVTTKVKSDNIKVGDSIMYYNNYQAKATIDEGKVTEISSNGKQFYLDSNTSVSDKYVLGNSDATKVYPVVGGVLEVLESRTGYLLIIIMPTLALFAYLIRKTMVEVKEEKKN